MAGFVVDQSNTLTPQQFYSTSDSSTTPIGQEFTPTLRSLDFVNLFIEDAGSDIGPGANFEVRIRTGSITGAILGTSLTTFVADGTNTGGGSTTTHFSFAAPVTLTPGSLDVIEVVQLAPIVVGNFNFGLDGNTSNVYPGGRAIIGGAAQPNFDFYFSEGTFVSATVPEPASLAMLGLGLIVVASRVRRGARDH